MIRTVLRKTKSVFHHGKPFLLLEACLALLFSSFVLRFLPYQWVTSIMNKNMKWKSTHDKDRKERLLFIGQTIEVASRNIPFELACFTQSLAAKIMLTRRRLKSLLNIGVMVNEEGIKKGHAWLTCGELVIVGRKQHENYKIIKAY